MQTLRLVRVGKVCEDAERFRDPWTAYFECYDMSELDREHFVALHLDGGNRIIARETISIGTMDQSLAHPREVFKAAVHNGSAGLILVHNHPTGDPSPSNADVYITKRLKKAGEIIGIRVLDHIIVGSYSFYSMERKKLETLPESLLKHMVIMRREKRSQAEKEKPLKKPSTRQPKSP